MRNRRFAIVAALAVIELWIVGLMIHSIAGGSHHAGFAASATQFGDPAAAAAATSAGTARIVQTGSSPHVVIDDEDATLSVSVRPGTTVEVAEQLQRSSWWHGDQRPVGIERSSDGVRIARAQSGLSVEFSSAAGRRLNVMVPPGARVDVENAGPTTVSGLRADVTLHSDDGSIVVADQRGAVEVKTDNGRIELNDVVGPSVKVSSDNGRVAFDRVSADRVSIVTDNGRIEVARSLLRGGKIQTDSGRIRLGLDPQSDVTVAAHTSSGKVIAEAPLLATGSGDDDAPATIRVGDGAGRLDVGSDDGSITVLAGGM